MTGAGPTGTVTGTFDPAGAGGYKARAGLSSQLAIPRATAFGLPAPLDAGTK